MPYPASMRTIQTRKQKVMDLEAKIGLGQAEELIAMAKDELKLLPKYIGRCIATSQ